MKKSSKWWPVHFLIALLAGIPNTAVSGDIYFHDPELLKRLQAAQTKLKGVNEKNGVPKTLLDNLEASVSKEKTVLDRVHETRFLYDLLQIETLDWERIRLCGEQSQCRRRPTIDACTKPKPWVGIPVAQPTSRRVQNLQNSAQSLTASIEELTASLEQDPDGMLPKIAVPTNRLDELTKRIKELDDKLIKWEAGVKDDLGLGDQFSKQADSIEAVITAADAAIVKVLKEDSNEHKALKNVLDILRKAKDLDLVKDGKLGEVFKKAKDTPLPDEIAPSLAKYVDPKLKTVGDLLNYLATEDASITLVRLELRKDLRRSLAEMRAQRISEKKAELELTQRELRLVQKQIDFETDLRLISEKDAERKTYTGCVFSRYEQMVAQYQQCLINPTECRSDSAQNIQRASNQHVEAIQAQRRGLQNYVSYVAIYIARVGYLEHEADLITLDRASMEHRNSIVRSQIASQARDRLVKNGLDGAVSFAEGGIKYDDVAGILRFIQTALLAVIAKKTD